MNILSSHGTASDRRTDRRTGRQRRLHLSLALAQLCATKTEELNESVTNLVKAVMYEGWRAAIPCSMYDHTCLNPTVNLCVPVCRSVRALLFHVLHVLVGQ